MSSLRDHFERTKAQKNAQLATAGLRTSAVIIDDPLPPGMANNAAADNTPNNADLTKLEVRFFNDWEQLSNIQSHQAKNAKKAELLPDYIPWIEGTISEGVGGQNDMLLKLMVWCLDTHNLTLATDIAQFALLNNMAMPEPFSRDVATVYAEQMADEGLKNITDIADYADVYAKAIELTSGYDMPDPVRAKLYRAWGNSQRNVHPSDAITAYERALKLDPSVGCKQDLNALKKQA